MKCCSASTPSTGYSGSDLFVSPDNLMLDYQFDCQSVPYQTEDYQGTLDGSGFSGNLPTSAAGNQFATNGPHIYEADRNLSPHSGANFTIKQTCGHPSSQTQHLPALQNERSGRLQRLGGQAPITPPDDMDISPFVTTNDAGLDYLSFKPVGMASGPNCWNAANCPVDTLNPALCHPATLKTSPPCTPAVSDRPSIPRRRSAQEDDPKDVLKPGKLKRNPTSPGDDADDENFNLKFQPRLSPEGRPLRRNAGRVPHNLVERRYRDNLNTQIESLRLAVPSLRDAFDCSADVEDSAAPAKLPSKAAIIQTAATYIKELETDRQQLQSTTRALQEQVAGLQKLVRCDDCSILQYLNQMQLEQPVMNGP